MQQCPGVECGRQWCIGYLLGPREHLFHQAGPGQQHITNFAIQPLGQAGQGFQGDGAIGLGLLQLAHALTRHAQATAQGLGTHAQCQPDGLRPAAPGGGVALQLGKFAELAIQVSQAGEVQAIFQGKGLDESALGNGLVAPISGSGNRELSIGGWGSVGHRFTQHVPLSSHARLPNGTD